MRPASRDRVRSFALINTDILDNFGWHKLARIWQTPVLGELFFMSANRPFLKRALDGDNPKPFPDESIDRIYSHMDRDHARAVLKLYRSARDIKAVVAPIMERLPLIADRPTLVVFGADAYIPARYADVRRKLPEGPGPRARRLRPLAVRRRPRPSGRAGDPVPRGRARTRFSQRGERGPLGVTPTSSANGSDLRSVEPL